MVGTVTVTTQAPRQAYDTTNEEWGLLPGHHRGLTHGHQWGLFHGHGQLDMYSEERPVVQPYSACHRQWAQEIISAEIAGEDAVRDSLLKEYCADEAMLACFLDFFYATVVLDDARSGPARFDFLQWMLGDLLVIIAHERGLEPDELVTGLMSIEVRDVLSPELALAATAAQTTLASHMLARTGRQPWGIASSLSAESLSQLTAGVHILLWLLCFGAREELGDVKMITHVADKSATSGAG